MRAPLSTNSIETQKGTRKRAKRLRIERLLVGGFLLISSLTQSWHFLTSGWETREGLRVTLAHDTLWHLALIKELARSFPPQQPGLAGLPLSNYHFLSDFLLMILHKLSGLSVETVYFHIAPPLVAFLFSLSAFLLAKKLTQSVFKSIVAAAFAVFGGSFAYLIPLLLGKDTPWFANSFMLDQPFEQLTNVHTILGFATFLFGASFLLRYLEERRSKDGIVAGILLGGVTAVKAHAGFVAVVSLLVAWATELVLRRKSPLTLPTMIATGLFIGLTLSLQTSEKPALEFMPGWILRRMVEDSNRFYNERFTQLYQHYQEAGNIPRLIQINLEELTLYIIGNLGVRILALIWIGAKLVRLSKATAMQLYLISVVMLSLALPLLFVQPVSVYNTIQFSPYALILLSILLVVWAPKKSAHTTFFVFLFLLAVPTTIKSFVLANQTPPNAIPPEELETLRQVATLPQDAVILTSPTSENRYLMKIPGLGGRRAYFSGETFAILTDAPYQYRLEVQREFYAPETTAPRRVQILKDAKITHVYSDEPSEITMLEGLEEERTFIRRIFENQKGAIFEVQ